MMKTRLHFGFVKSKISGSGLPLEGKQRTLYHIPAIDRVVGRLQPLAIHRDLEDDQAVRLRKRFRKHGIMDEREGGNRTAQVKNDLNEEKAYDKPIHL